MKAALYARFSTDKQREASIDDQHRQNQRVADGHQLLVGLRFADEGISGGTAQRPGYQSMLDAARRGEFDVIIAEDISRLWRNRAEYGSRSAELEDLGVHLLTAVGDDTRRDGWMVVTIKLALAEQGRREISYRTRRGMEGLALNGQSTGGRCYGYRNGDIYEHEAKTVRQIFAWAVEYGCNTRWIAKRLNATTLEFFPAPRGGRWSHSTIQGILANRRYTGAVIYGATESKGGARDSRLKTRVERSGGPIASRQDESKRIVSDELFAAVNGQAQV